MSFGEDSFLISLPNLNCTSFFLRNQSRIHRQINLSIAQPIDPKKEPNNKPYTKKEYFSIYPSVIYMW